MSSGGKGDSQSTQLDPELKQRLIKTFDRGSQLSQTAPMTYMGLTQADPSDMTKSWMNQTNSMANKLGLGMASGQPTDSLPEHEREMGGLKGYRAHRGYVQELQRQHNQYPERVAALNQLVPGLLNPGMVHRGKPGMFPNVSKTNGPAYPGAMDFQQIADMYKRYRR